MQGSPLSGNGLATLSVQGVSWYLHGEKPELVGYGVSGCEGVRVHINFWGIQIVGESGGHRAIGIGGLVRVGGS